MKSNRLQITKVNYPLWWLQINSYIYALNHWGGDQQAKKVI